MDAAERDTFLRGPHTAVFATVGRDGRAHAVPVWYLWDGEAFRILTERGSQKHMNAERTGRAALCIDQRDGKFIFVTGEGPVEVRGTVTHEDRLALWSHYVGPERAAAQVGGKVHEGMVMLILRPDRWLS